VDGVRRANGPPDLADTEPRDVRTRSVGLDQLSSLDDPPSAHPADTDTELVTVVDCSTPQQIRLRVLVTDPATGKQLVDRPVSPLDGQPRASVASLTVDGPAADKSVSLHLLAARNLLAVMLAKSR
jgi:hypothetical protein